MNESKLQEIARLCAFCFGQDHDYTPNHADEEWQAHGWVIEAMKAALAAAPTPAPVPVDPAELEALRRDAARYRWLRDEPSSHLYVRLKEKMTTSGMSVCSGPTLDYEIDKRIADVIAQHPRLFCGDKRPCDAGEICIGCQPRECPDAQPRVPDEMVLTDYRGGYGINTKHGFQRGTKFVEATRDEANGWNACRAAMLGDKA